MAETEEQPKGPSATHPAARVRRLLAAKPEALAFLEALPEAEVQALYEHLARYAIRVAAVRERGAAL